MSRIVMVLGCVLVLAVPCLGQTPPRTHDVTVDDYFTLAGVGEVAMSPDGKLVAYTEGRWQKSTNDRKTDLWVVNVNSKETKRLTSDRANDRSVKWGPDNKTLYFLGNRKREGEKQPPYDGKTQVWSVTVDGGQPTAITRVENGVDAFDITADGKTLFYAVAVSSTDNDEFTPLREKFALEHGHGKRQVSQVWKLDLNSWRAEKVIDEKRYVREFSITPDGKRLAMITAPDDTVITSEGRSTVDIWEAGADKVTRLDDRLWRKEAPSPYAWLESLAWAPDGKRLAFNAIFDAYPAGIIVSTWKDPEQVDSKRLPRGRASVRGYGTPLQWMSGDRLAWLMEYDDAVALADTNVTKDETGFFLGGSLLVSAFSLHPTSGQVAAVVSTGTPGFPQIVFAENPIPMAGPRKLLDNNPQTATWKLPTIEYVWWKGAKGDEVWGVLELPPDYEKGKKVPLVVGIHGGPTTMVHPYTTYDIFEGRMYLPAHGYAVLCPNYRGSTGSGDKFITDLVGHENDIEVEDILKGVDAMVERGIADSDKLGIMGWSNGGYLTNCCITKTTRFKAASSGASILDCVMEWGTNDEPAYPTVFKTGFPWEKPEIYRKTSPSYDLGKVRTPTLIHVGGSDERCPPGHSRMLYRALRGYVKVPTELVVYPGEPHGPMKYLHRQAKMEWDLAWFDRYVLGKK